MGKIIEGYWDCPQCGTKKIRGRYRYCSSCGRPRGDGVKFYMIETDNYVEDQENANREPDWYCSFCQSLNSSKSKYCESCGASQEDSDENYFEMLNRNEAKKQEEDRLQKETEDLANNYNSKDVSEKKPESSFLDKIPSWAKKAALFLIPALLIMMLIYAMIPKQTELHVLDKSWEREVEVQEYKTVREKDWAVPPGGRIAYTQEEIHHYNQVIDHYETVTEEKSERYVSGYRTVVTGHRDLGNGNFEEITSEEPIYDTRTWTETRQEPVYVSIPVYETKYYYDIERWIHKEWLKTSGTTDEPYWHELDLIPDTEREGEHKETYTIKVENKKEKEFTYNLSYDDWSKINKDSMLTVKISMGEIKEIVEIK